MTVNHLPTVTTAAANISTNIIIIHYNYIVEHSPTEIKLTDYECAENRSDTVSIIHFNNALFYFNKPIFCRKTTPLMYFIGRTNAHVHCSWCKSLLKCAIKMACMCVCVFPCIILREIFVLIYSRWIFCRERERDKYTREMCRCVRMCVTFSHTNTHIATTHTTLYQHDTEKPT